MKRLPSCASGSQWFFDDLLEFLGLPNWPTELKAVSHIYIYTCTWHMRSDEKRNFLEDTRCILVVAAELYAVVDLQPGLKWAKVIEKHQNIIRLIEMDESTPNMIRLVRCLSHGPIWTLHVHRWNFTPKRWMPFQGFFGTGGWSCLFEVLELCEGGELHLDSGWWLVLCVISGEYASHDGRKRKVCLGCCFETPQISIRETYAKDCLQLSEGEVNTSDVNQTAR